MGLFSINESTSEGTGSKSINVRSEADFIQQGKITKYELSEDKRFINIEFTNTKNQTANKRLYLPKDESGYADQDKYKKAISIFMGNMANVSRKFMGDTYKCDGDSVIQVVEKVIKDITPRLNNVTLFCAMELNKGDKGIFTNVGSFSPFSLTGEDIVIMAKQKELLKEKLAYKPDADKPVEFKEGKKNDDLPF